MKDSRRPIRKIPRDLKIFPAILQQVQDERKGYTKFGISGFLDSRLRGKDGRGGRPHPLLLKPVALFPLILNLLKDGNGGGKRRMARNGGRPSFNKFRMSGKDIPGSG